VNKKLQKRYFYSKILTPPTTAKKNFFHHASPWEIDGKLGKIIRFRIYKSLKKTTNKN